MCSNIGTARSPSKTRNICICSPASHQFIPLAGHTSPHCIMQLYKSVLPISAIGEFLGLALLHPSLGYFLHSATSPFNALFSPSPLQNTLSLTCPFTPSLVNVSSEASRRISVTSSIKNEPRQVFLFDHLILVAATSDSDGFFEHQLDIKVTIKA